MTFAQEMAAAAAELVSEFGEPVLVRWPAGDGAAVPEYLEATAAFEPVSASMADGVTVTLSDTVAWVTGLSDPPAEGGTVERLGTGREYRILLAREFSTQGAAVAWQLVLRA